MASYPTLLEFSRLSGLGDLLGEISEVEQLERINDASDVLDDYLRTAGYDLPIPQASISRQMKRVVSHVAAYDLLFGTGFDPTTNSDSEVVKRYEQAVKWMESVAAKRIVPIPIVDGQVQDAVPEDDPIGAAVSSETARGWSRLAV